MFRIIMTKGLPGSGKSTWAKKFVEEHGVKRVNKDDLRAMLDFGKWSKGNEKTIIKVRDEIIHTVLRSGNSIIVDDTNLHPKHEMRLREIASEYKAGFEVQDFTDVPLEECIKRDLQRNRSVGKDVIVRMHRQFLVGEPTPAPEYDPNLSPCIIVDVDGTIAHNDGHRKFYEWDKVGGDKPKNNIIDLVNAYEMYANIIVFSGRDGCCIDLTRKWLEDNYVKFDQLYQREAGDNRKDSIIKRELYEQHVQGKYNVLFVLDDRDQVVDMWRNELGLTCLQVNYGDF